MKIRKRALPVLCATTVMNASGCAPELETLTDAQHEQVGKWVKQAQTVGQDFTIALVDKMEINFYNGNGKTVNADSVKQEIKDTVEELVMYYDEGRIYGYHGLDTSRKNAGAFNKRGDKIIGLNLDVEDFEYQIGLKALMHEANHDLIFRDGFQGWHGHAQEVVNAAQDTQNYSSVETVTEIIAHKDFPYTLSVLFQATDHIIWEYENSIAGIEGYVTVGIADGSLTREAADQVLSDVYQQAAEESTAIANAYYEFADGLKQFGIVQCEFEEVVTTTLLPYYESGLEAAIDRFEETYPEVQEGVLKPEAAEVGPLKVPEISSKRAMPLR